MAKKVIFDIEIKGSKAVLDLQKQIQELKKALRTTGDPTIADKLVKELALAEINLKKAKEEAKRAQAAFIASDETAGSYKRLSAQLFLARERFKELASQAAIGGNVSKKQLQEANAEANRLNSRLAQIDQATGVFGRNVGNYAGSLKGLFKDLKQTILTSGFIGRAGIIGFSQQLLDVANKVLDTFDKLQTTFDANYATQKLINSGIREAVSEYGKEIGQIQGLLAVANDKKASDEDRENAIAALNKTYKEYLPSLGEENLSIEQLNENYPKLNEQIRQSVANRIRAKLVEEAILDSIEAQREAQKSAALAEVDRFSVSSQLYNAYIQQQADTKKAVAGNVDAIQKAIEETLSSIKDLDFSKTFDDTSKNIEALADKTGDSVKNLREKAQKESEKAAEQYKKEFERVSKETAQFSASQVETYSELQRTLKQSVLDAMEEGKSKEIAAEKLNFETLKSERARQFAKTIQQIEEQEARLIAFFSENSKEVLAFREETAKSITQLESVYNQITENDAKAHQSRLTYIQAQGADDRTEQDQEAFNKTLALYEAQNADIQRVYEYQQLLLQEAIAKGNVTVEQGARQDFEIRQGALNDEIQLLNNRIDAGVFASEEERQQLVLARQKLNTELAQLDQERTADEQEEIKKRKASRLQEIEEAINSFGSILSATQDVVDGFNQAEQDRIQQHIDLRQQNIDALDQQLQDATGNQKIYLQQQLKQEERALKASEEQQKKVRKEAAVANKAFAIAQAGINAALSVTNLLATLIDPTPVQAFKIAALAFTTALNIAAIAQIAATPLKYAQGGYTGGGAGTPDETGFKAAGIVHEGEWVAPKWQVQHPTYSPHIRFLESGRQRGYAGGGFAAAAPPPLPQSIVSSANARNNGFDIGVLDARISEIADRRILATDIRYTPQTEADRKADEKDRINIKNASTL